jgi:hypothetical protein
MGGTRALGGGYGEIRRRLVHDPYRKIHVVRKFEPIKHYGWEWWCGRREKGARNSAKRADAGGDMQHAKRILLRVRNAHLAGGLCPNPLPTG